MSHHWRYLYVQGLNFFPQARQVIVIFPAPINPVTTENPRLFALRDCDPHLGQ